VDEREDQRCNSEVGEGNWQQNLPAQIHHLVVAEARDGPADHELQPENDKRFGDHRADAQKDDNAIRKGDIYIARTEVKSVAVKVGYLPSAEEQRRDEGTDKDGDNVFGKLNSCEFHRGELGEIPGDELGFRLRQVKGAAFSFGEHGEEEYKEDQQLYDDALSGHPPPHQLS